LARAQATDNLKIDLKSPNFFILQLGRFELIFTHGLKIRPRPLALLRLNKIG
jgi:hypothetical protein